MNCPMQLSLVHIAAVLVQASHGVEEVVNVFHGIR